MNKYAIIVAGGSGTRMKSTVPKQFMKLNGRPVLFHTLEKFAAAGNDIELILVLPKDQIAFWKGLCSSAKFDIPHQITEGGETRFHSVRNGLREIKGDGIVAVHDGVRPLISTSLIQRLFSAAEKSGNAIPAIPVHESMRSVEGEKNLFADRSKFRLIQTPQCFHISQLKKAFELDYVPAFTDEANVAESAGFNIHLVEGERRNIKITTADDLVFAEALLGSK